MARTGMTDIITELRGMTEAGTADYTITTTTYWSDNDLQSILDRHRTDVVFEQLQIFPVRISGGSISYQDYRSSYDWLEQTTGGTAVMYLQDSTGAVIGTANYTPDYVRGQFQFNSDQSGSIYYLTGRSYDMNGAAADVWRRKAAHYAPTSFDFSTDNHTINRSAVYKHCKEMAEYFENMGADAISTVQMFRADMGEVWQVNEDDT